MTQDNSKKEENNNFDLTLEALYEVPVQLSVVLGRSTMKLNEILSLRRGAVVELDKNVGEPAEVFVNNQLVAKGEIVVVDKKIGITLTEVLKPS
ncbi:MAG: flagellar motor switch protein FliN [Rickettsiaceae bacterium]